MLSVSVCGRAMVSMPSCTTPIFSKMPVICKATQPEAATICMVIGSAMATTPTAICPLRQSQMAKAPVKVISSAFKMVSDSPSSVLMRNCSWKRSL